MVHLLRHQPTAHIWVFCITLVAVHPAATNNFAASVSHRFFGAHPAKHYITKVVEFIEHRILRGLIRKILIGVLILILRLEVAIQAQ